MVIDNKTVEKYAKEKQVFTFQAACKYFNCDFVTGNTEKNKRFLLQTGLFYLIEKNLLTYNPETGYYRYLGA